MTKVRWILAAVVVALGTRSVVGQHGGNAAALLEAARKAEVVDGNLAAAVKQYEAIVATFAKSDRPAAAQALLRMAECYQKLGHSQSRAAYERLVREFADQPEPVTIARARLGDGGDHRVARGDRAVWTGRDVDLFGTVSPDGRYLTFIDWAKTQNLMLRDLVANTTRALTSNVSYGEFGYPQWSAISRSGDQVAFEWGQKNGTTELHVGAIHASPFKTRRVHVFEGGESVRPFDWSPDGTSLAVLIERRDKSSQLAVVSVADGAVRGLKSIMWRGTDKMVFSPDGRHIAYGLASESRDRTRIFIIAVDGSQETVAVDDASHNTVMGWAPDGRLVFVSDRTGSRTLWTVRVSQGRVHEVPRLVRDNIGSTVSLGLTPSGTLYLWQHASANFVQVSSFDMTAGNVLESDNAFRQFIDSRGRPRWNADGRYLLFISCGSSGGGPCAMFVRASETGIVREVKHSLNYVGFPTLSPDGRTIAANGTDLKGRGGVYLVDVATGETSVVARSEDGRRVQNPDWTADGRLLYTDKHGDSSTLLECDLSTQQTREVYRADKESVGAIHLSPDGRMVAFVSDDLARRTSELVVAPIAGGAPRVLAGWPETFSIHPMRVQWTSDSRAVIFARTIGDGTELWRAPIDAAARKMDIDTRQWAEGFHIHPNGRQIAFAAQAGASGDEVWAIENFLTKKP